LEILTAARARELLDDIASVRALVVGDLMIDRYVSGVVDRVSPEAPVPVVRVEEERTAIGGAGNVAANITALGASCVVVGCVGDDDAAPLMCSVLAKIGVATDGLVVAEGRPTTVKTRVMARHQQIVRFDREDESDVPASTAGQLARSIREQALSCDVLVLEDYNKGVLAPAVIDAARRAARERSLPTIVDPKRRNFFAFQGATVFKPNAKELEDALGSFIHPEDADWMRSTRERLGCEHLLLTLGERGVALESLGAGYLRVPTAARSVYDVSGAGDTVTAVVATVLAAGGSAAEAAVLANHAAAVGVAKTGVATVSPEEILGHIQDHS
jgi:D-beta-D-heptose 7-phosphate kinase/D-beta-D-heptose 1-phosphate adenosyltransferase